MAVQRVPVAVVLCLLAALTLAGTTSPAASADEAVVDGTSLALNQLGDSVLDPAKDLLYVAGGTQDSVVEVLRPDGTLVKQLSLGGPVGHLFVSADGSTLLASLPDQNIIDQVDTSTWQVSAVPTGYAPCADYPVMAGGRIFFTESTYAYDCRDGSQLMELDPATGVVSEAFPTSRSGQFDYRTEVRGVPGRPLLLVVDHQGDLSLVDVSATPTVVSTAQTSLDASPVFAPDGSSVIVGHTTYSVPDLSVQSQLPLTDTSVVTAADSDTLVEDSGVYDRSTGTLLNEIDFGRPVGRAPSATFMDGGHLLALAQSGNSVTFYDVPAPRTPSPTLTVQAADTVAMHPADITGSLIDQGTPLAGVDIVVIDDGGNTIAETTTASDGTWTVHPTFTETGWLPLYVRSGPVAGHKQAVVYSRVQVDPPTITVSAPSSAAPHDTVDVTGSLTALGDPVPASDVNWKQYCLDPNYDSYYPVASGEVLSRADGSFTLTIDPGQCIDSRVAFEWQESVASDASAHVDVHVPWRTASITYDTSVPTVYVGDHVVGTATYAVDGTPTAGVPVRVDITGPNGEVSNSIEMTDPSGQVPVQFDVPLRGGYDVWLSADGTSDTLPAYASDGFYASPIATTITLAASAQQVNPGDTVTLSGAISRVAGPIDGIGLQLQAVDLHSDHQRTYDTVTDAQGGYTFTDVPVSWGTTDYVVSYAGDGTRYLDASASTDVSVAAAQPTVTLTTDKAAYVAGDTATVHVDVSGSPSRHIVLTQGNPSAGESATLFDGVVPAGGIDVPLPLIETDVLTAVSPADDLQVSARQALRVPVAMRLSIQAVHPFGVTADGVAHYRAVAQPKFAATTSPARQVCLSFVVQHRNRGEAWTTYRTSECRPSNGRVTYQLLGRSNPLGQYRVRALFAPDWLNGAAVSAWQRFDLQNYMWSA